jgi:hypothetical protein
MDSPPSLLCMSGIPHALVLSEEEMAAMADTAVAELARQLAGRAFRQLHDAEAATAADAALAGADGAATVVDGAALARLHALVHLQRAVERQKDRAAETAVRDGAGYPQLGHACAMSRQGARRRWPGLVPSTSSLTRATVAHPSVFPGAHATAHPASIDRSL